MASADNPMKSEAISKPSGYIEVIGCAAAVDSNNLLGSILPADALATDAKTATAHGDHAALRTAYQNAANSARGIVNPIFNNGVITSGAAVPGVDVSTARTTTTNTFGDGKADYFFGEVPNVLTGDVRITDTVNGKDMIMPAVKLQNVTDPDATDAATATANSVEMALMFVEGEAANIADRALIGANAAAGNADIVAGTTVARSEYDYTRLAGDAAVFNTNNVYMTYGDSSSLANNQLILTSPYKRLLINADANAINTGATPAAVSSNNNIGIIGTVYSGVQSANGSISNWGTMKALALIFDESENQAQASQFSPANTPTMTFAYEVSASEGNAADTDNLSYYLNQAGSSFTKGYAIINFRNDGAAGPVPTIATQMLATDVAGKVITNWIVPEQN